MLASPCWLGDAFCALIVPSLPLSRGGGDGAGAYKAWESASA